MNVTMCTNNHYFDSDMYDVCPICGAGVKANNFRIPGKILGIAQIRRSVS